MRKVLFMILLAFAVVPVAAAKNPHDQTEPSPSTTTVVSGPSKVQPGDLPLGPTHAPVGAATATASCGACINTCWSATVRAGSGDWSGHVFRYQHLGWCGNGAQITAAGVSQTYDQSGWYQLQGGYGPWWSGGCVGCDSIAASGYILWSWTAQLIGVSHSGTSSVTSTMRAYGGLSY